METSWNRNQAALRGRAGGQPRFSHTNHGMTYLTFPLEVARLSGAMDTLNVVVSEDMLSACPVEPGGEYQVTGEVRSFNNRSGVGSRLVITFFARTLAPAQGEHANQLELTGVLCKEPVVRRTPLGREICALLLAGSVCLVENPFSLSGMMEEVAQIIQTDIGQKGQHLFVRLEGLVHDAVHGDMVRVKEILLNLLSNAVKYTP